MTPSPRTMILLSRVLSVFISLVALVHAFRITTTNTGATPRHPKRDSTIMTNDNTQPDPSKQRSPYEDFKMANKNIEMFPNTSPSNRWSAYGNFEDYFNRPGPWDEKDLDSLLKANKAWTSRMTQTDPEFFKHHELGHAPKILWIGCSDARVPANEIIGEEPGTVFVHRNIANQVNNNDFNCMSVIQYAVDVLQVKHIIVCGHYDCGGIRASLESVDHKSPLENWLRNIRDTYRLHRSELNVISDPIARQRRLVEVNVIEQCLNIFKTAVVQRKRVETYELKQGGDKKIRFTEPRIHGFVYEPTSGDLKKLEVDFGEYMTDLRQVYDLYKPDGKPEATQHSSMPSKLEEQ